MGALRVATVALSLLAVIAVSLWYQGGGFLDRESHYFIQNYLDDRPLVQKVFDVHRNEPETYQARELTYLFDLIDCQVIKLSLRNGFLHFYPLSHYLGIFLIAVLQVLLVARYFPGVPFSVNFLLALLYVTTPSSWIMSYFRSAKILAASSLFFLVWYAFLVPGLRPVRFGSERGASLFVVFAGALFMSLSDRQGFFFCLALAAIAGTLYWLAQRRYWRDLAIVFGIVVAVNSLYNYSVGPWVIHNVTGSYPSMSFQDMGFLYQFERLTWKTRIGRLGHTFLVMPELVSYFFGNSGKLMGLAVLGGALGNCMGADRRDEPQRVLGPRAILFVMALLGLYALNFVMAMKAHYVLWIDHKLVYYWVPMNALALIGTGIAANQLYGARLSVMGHRIVLALLAVCLVRNAVSLPDHHRAYSLGASHFAVNHAVTRDIFRCLREKNVESHQFGMPEESRKVCVLLRRWYEPRG